MAYPYNLGKILQLMGYDPEADYEVKDDEDGNGPYFVSFSGSPVPSEDDINTFYTNYQASPDRLVDAKHVAKIEIDNMAEIVRLKYITAGFGQSMTYQEKAAEAQEYKDAGYPTITGSEYPWVKAEMDATGDNGQTAADDILAQRAAWVAIGTVIERERRLGKINVDAAGDESAVTTAKDAALVTLGAL